MLVKRDFRKWYINGSLRFQTPNFYAIWNNWMFKLYQKYTKKTKK